jgi:hypothetical protein
VPRRDRPTSNSKMTKDVLKVDFKETRPLSLPCTALMILLNYSMYNTCVPKFSGALSRVPIALRKERWNASCMDVNRSRTRTLSSTKPTAPNSRHRNLSRRNSRPNIGRSVSSSLQQRRTVAANRRIATFPMIACPHVNCRV